MGMAFENLDQHKLAAVCQQAEIDWQLGAKWVKKQARVLTSTRRADFFLQAVCSSLQPFGKGWTSQSTDGILAFSALIDNVTFDLTVLLNSIFCRSTSLVAITLPTCLTEFSIIVKTKELSRPLGRKGNRKFTGIPVFSVWFGKSSTLQSYYICLPAIG